MSASDILNLPAADMTVQQHLAINLMIPVSGCEELDRMIWEAKRDHIATQIMARMIEASTVSTYEKIGAEAYLAADAQLAASGWEQGEPA
jgi:hypothetical protein